MNDQFSPVRLRLARAVVRIQVSGQIPHRNVPNFDFSTQKGLLTTWGMHKRRVRGNVRIAMMLSGIEALKMAPNFTVDGQQIMILAEYLEGYQA